MPGLTYPRRQKRASEESNDDDDSDALSSSSAGNKRARLNPNASIQSLAESSISRSRGPSSRLQNGHRDEDDSSAEAFQPGSLVRVKMVNFVTYSKAEFRPGPSLNMVIGPNGTGKSTLVCAICLGLGWSPSNLGRAKDVGEYVRHGSREAEIEIELAGGPNHSRNPVVRRVIKKEGSKSNFFINNRPSTQKAVVELARSFSIQIDNLCQFLPQEKVVEFAALDKVALLRETQRAAAPAYMLEWHEQLKQLNGEQKEKENSRKNEQQHLNKLQARQNAQREDVERWEQRQQLEKKAKILEKCKPFADYRAIRDQVNNAKDQREAVQAELNQLLRDEQPFVKAKEDKEAYRDKIVQALEMRQTNFQMQEKRVDEWGPKLKAKQDLLKDLANQLDAETAAVPERRRNLKRLEGSIAELRQKIEQAPPEFDPKPYTDRKNEVDRKMREIGPRMNEIREQMEDINTRARGRKADLTAKVDERQNLDSQTGQREAALKRLNPSAAQAWDWVQQNRDKFEGEVYGPPVVTCSITDPRFCDAIETRISQNDMTAITCTTRADNKVLQDNLFEKGLKLHNVSIRESIQPLSYFRAPVDQEKLHQLGFEGWALDFIQGPEPVLAFLCDNAGFHRTALTPQRISDNQYEAVKRSPITHWVAGSEIYQITRRREYGPNAESTTVRPVRRATVFTDQPMDVEEKRALERDITSLKRDLHTLKEEHANLKEELVRLSPTYDELAEERKQIQRERDAEQNIANQFKLLPRQLENKEEERDRLKSRAQATKSKILQLKTQSEKATLEIASLTVQLTKALELLRRAQDNVVEAQIRRIEADSEVEALSEANDQARIMIQEKQTALEGLKEQIKRSSQQAKELYRKCQVIQNGLGEEETEIHNEYRLASREDLDAEISAVNTRLELIADGDPNAVTAYRAREADIERTQSKVDSLNEKLEAIGAKTAEIRSQWEPELDELVARISENFSNHFKMIGCSGQIDVGKEEEFDQWRILIQVSFREDEPMSLLDSQRQSGGERAVSTIFYLMALQGLARSPFRVVDEINQGMDPRNERMVHGRMVDIACEENTSQYFLITPKLLTHLKYHPKMKVHVIASGEWMPSDYTQLDFRRLAETAIRLKSQQQKQQQHTVRSAA